MRKRFYSQSWAYFCLSFPLMMFQSPLPRYKSLPIRAHPFHSDSLSLSQLGGGAIAEGNAPTAADAGSVVHSHDYVRGLKANQGPGFIHDYVSVAEVDGVQSTQGGALQCQELAVDQA